MALDKQTIWNKAEIHGDATKTKKPVDGKFHACECCFKPIIAEEISLCSNTKELEFLGFGIPIYYSFIRCCMMLLIVSIFSYSLAEIHRNYVLNTQSCAQLQHATASSETGHEHLLVRHFSEIQEVSENVQAEGHEGAHQPQYCIYPLMRISSTSKKTEDFQMIIRIGSFILHVFFLLYIHKKQHQLYSYYDERTCSLSDYSIIMNNIPQGKGNKAGIRNFIKKSGLPESSIKQIILFPNNSKVLKLEQQIVEKHKQYFHAFNNKKSSQQEKEELEKEIEELEEHKIRKIQKKKRKYQNDQLFVETAIVVFDTETIKQSFLEQVEELKQAQQQWRHAKIKEAAQPQQIIWENMGVSNHSQNIRSLISYSLSFLVIVVVTILFAIIIRYKTIKLQQILQEQSKSQENHYSLEITILVYGALIAVVLFNKLLMVKLFHKFTDFERKRTSNIFQFSLCIKYCLGLFFTTALMTLIVEDFMFGNFYSHPYGVIHMESIMFILNSAFVPFFWAINPYYISKKLSRYFKKKKSYISQEEASETMEDPIYEIGKRYAQIMQIMWFTFLYFSLIPLGAICSCIGLFLYYWVDKYNLLRKSSLKIDVSGKLADMTLNLLDFTLFWRTAGDFLYDYQIRDGFHLPTAIMMGISIIFILLPKKMLIEKVVGQKYALQQRTYTETKKSFKINYYTYSLLYSSLSEDRRKLAEQLDVTLVSSIIDRSLKSKNNNTTMV